MKTYFHGQKQTGPYFEGWYLKCRAGDGRSLAVIPALHIHPEGQRSASIQVITEDQTWWLEYPASSFTAEEQSFCVRIGGTVLSEKGAYLDIRGDGITLRGTVAFGPFRPLRSDIMGPFRWLSNLECAHSVISMAHSLQGSLELNGTVLDLHGGTGYLESDRGRSFPAAYLWTQCTWNRGSMMLSIAKIPLGRFSFTGCICALILNEKEHRIATYLGARIESWSARCAVLRQGRYRLEVELLDQKNQPLRAPSEGRMNRTVHESLCARVCCRFWQGDKLLLDQTDANAGFEYAEG